jgi:hypothetical protein
MLSASFKHGAMTESSGRVVIGVKTGLLHVRHGEKRAMTRSIEDGVHGQPPRRSAGRAC